MEEKYKLRYLPLFYEDMESKLHYIAKKLKNKKMKVKNVILPLLILLLSLTGCQQSLQDTETHESINSQVETNTENQKDTMSQEREELGSSEPTSELPTEMESDESTQEFPTPTDDAFVRVQDYIPTIQQELRYATTNNFTGQVIYTFEEAYLRYGTVKKLQQVCEELETYGIGIKIWDAFRPLQAQAKLWEVCPDEKYVSHPNKGNRNHCRGLAVDITLYDLKTGKELEMPSGFDEFSALGDREYSDCSAKATENSKLLESIMTKCGFKGYSKEWWHYNDTDTYPIEEVFVPAE